MLVDPPGAVHFQRDSDTSRVTVMFSDYLWQEYKGIKKKVKLALGAIGLQVDSDVAQPLIDQVPDVSDKIVNISNHLIGMLSFDYGPVSFQIQLWAFMTALAIHELAGKIAVCGYEVVGYPPKVGKSKVGRLAPGQRGYNIQPAKVN